MRMEETNGITVGKWVVLAFIALFGLVGFFQSWVTIPAGCRGVVMHWNAVQKSVLGEGLHFTCPYMTSVQKMSVRIKKDQVDASAASRDMQKVDARLAINWHLNPEDVQTVYQTVGEEEQVIERVLIPAVQEVFKAASAQKAAEEILAKRTELKDAVDNSLKARLAKYGIQVDDVSIIDIEFSKEFNNAIEAKQIAEQDAKKAVYAAQQKKAEADGKINEARGQAESQRLIISTLSDKILMQRAIEKWDGRFPAVMGGGNLPLLDLRKLQSGGE